MPIMIVFRGVLVVCLLVATVPPLNAFLVRRSVSPVSSVTTLDNELEKTAIRPNRWGYELTWIPPHVSDVGLTEYIDTHFIFKNKRFESIDESEKLFVEIYRDYLRDINGIRILRPFLTTFPLTPDSCQLVLGFRDSTGNSVRPPNIASILMRNDTLVFTKFVDQGNIAGSPFETICSRPMHDISGLKELYSAGVPRKDVDPKPVIPKLQKLHWRFDNWAALQAEFVFANEFCLKHGLEVVAMETSGSSYENLRPFESALMGSQRLSLDASRTLAATYARDLLDFVQKNSEVLSLMKIRATKRNSLNDTSVIPEPRHLSFRISFWDENVDRQPAPYIAEIHLMDKKFSYFTSDDLQRLVLVREESFDDALAFLKGAASQES